jgi:hypothetical protein
VATPPAPTPPLVTLRSQELQPFAQALGDLVEVGNTRVGEARIDAAATPLAFGFGLGGGVFALGCSLGFPRLLEESRGLLCLGRSLDQSTPPRLLQPLTQHQCSKPPSLPLC